MKRFFIFSKKIIKSKIIFFIYISFIFVFMQACSVSGDRVEKNTFSTEFSLYLFDKPSSQSSFQELEHVFFSTFSSLYQSIPHKDLNPKFEREIDVNMWIRETIQQELQEAEKDPSIYLLVVRKNSENRTIGLAILQRVHKHQTPGIHIRQMAILPEFQGKGIGSSIITHIIKDNKNITYIIADTRILNKGAINFYKNRGFTVKEEPNDPSLCQKKYVGLFLKIVR